MNPDELNAGREMDALVAEKVMDYNRHEWNALSGTQNTDYCLKCGITRRRDNTLPAPQDFCKHEPLHYSTDIAAAWMVIERMIKLGKHEFVDEFIIHPPLYGMRAEFAALTICRAALKATMSP